MPAPVTGVWGIDLGQCALKALRIEEVDGQLTATAFDYVEYPKILNQPDADPDQLMREALETFLSRNTLRGDIVAISVPSQSGLARFVKLPPVEEKKIQDIVRFEAKQQIPFNLEEVVWDYQKIGAGIVTDGFAMETEIGLFAMKRDKVTSYLQQFKEVKVEVHIVQMSPLALCNYVAYDLLKKGPPGDVSGGEEEKPAGGKRRCVVALDIGTDTSNLVITDGDRIIWQRPIPLGGNHFTRALTKDPFKLTFAKAEHLKRNATKSGPDLKKILTALKPVLNDFVGEVQRSLGYFTNTHRDAQVEYMIGLGNAFRLPGMQRFLGEKLGLDVRKLAKLERLEGDAVTAAPAFTENLPTFAVAYGLALQGQKLARLQTNLLPPEIRVERLIRAKKPWAVAAAACLLLGVGSLMAGKAAQINAYNPDNPTLGGAMKQADDVVKKVNGAKGSFDNKAKEIATIEGDVKSLTAGERLDWILLNKFISDSLPRSQFDRKGQLIGIGPLTPAARKTYWDGDPLAAKAHQYLLTKVQQEGRSIKDVAREFMEEQVKLRGQGARPKEVDNLEAHLIQVSIEAMDCRYSMELGEFWKSFKAANAHEDVDVRNIIRAADQAALDKGPDGPGWVIELRGHTYSKGNRFFIRDVLIDNLALTAGLSTAAPGAATPATGGADAAKEAPKDQSQATEPGKMEHPVKGKIPYVMLVTMSDPAQVSPPEASVAGMTHLPAFVTDAPSAAAGGGEAAGKDNPGMPSLGGAGMGGGAGPGASQTASGRWLPVGGSAAGYQGEGAPAAGSGRGPGIGAPAGGRKTGGMGGGMVPGMGLPSGPGGGGIPPAGRGGAPSTPAPNAQSSTLVRTDFVIFLVWKEPMPSDKLIWPEGAPAGGGVDVGGGGTNAPMAAGGAALGQSQGGATGPGAPGGGMPGLGLPGGFKGPGGPAAPSAGPGLGRPS